MAVHTRSSGKDHPFVGVFNEAIKASRKGTNLKTQTDAAKALLEWSVDDLYEVFGTDKEKSVLSEPENADISELTRKGFAGIAAQMHGDMIKKIADRNVQAEKAAELDGEFLDLLIRSKNLVPHTEVGRTMDEVCDDADRKAKYLKEHGQISQFWE
jgi:hypothetical protein